MERRCPETQVMPCISGCTKIIFPVRFPKGYAPSFPPPPGNRFQIPLGESDGRVGPIGEVAGAGRPFFRHPSQVEGGVPPYPRK